MDPFTNYTSASTNQNLWCTPRHLFGDLIYSELNGRKTLWFQSVDYKYGDKLEGFSYERTREESIDFLSEKLRVFGSLALWKNMLKMV
jgi:hypothetical protein